MAVAIAWSFAAAWFSANLVISVVAELASYWLSLLAVLLGAYLQLRILRRPVSLANVLWRSWLSVAALVIVVVCWRQSDERFALWKMRAISPKEWSEMVSELRKFGTEIAQSGVTSASATMVPPETLRSIGSGTDYSGAFGNIITSSEYSGLTAEILFGYKGRGWGLCVGPESFAEKYSRGTNYIRVATDGFFFCSPRD